MTDEDEDMDQCPVWWWSEMSFTRERVNSRAYCAKGMGKMCVISGGIESHC